MVVIVGGSWFDGHVDDVCGGIGEAAVYSLKFVSQSIRLRLKGKQRHEPLRVLLSSKSLPKYIKRIELGEVGRGSQSVAAKG